MSSKTITLDTPIKRGETEITSIDIRKPDAGALRGCSLRALMNFETDAIMAVLPRVTEPPLTAQEVMLMDPADLLDAGSEIATFLLKKRELQAAQAALGYPPASTMQ
jgi:hypothetical protein